MRTLRFVFIEKAERLKREAKNGAVRKQLLAIAASYDGLAETILIIARQREGI